MGIVINETVHCHITVLTHMLGQLTQMRNFMEDVKPPDMSAQKYRKTMSDIGAQHAAMSFAVSILSHAYGYHPDTAVGRVVSTGTYDHDKKTTVYDPANAHPTGQNMDDIGDVTG